MGLKMRENIKSWKPYIGMKGDSITGIYVDLNHVNRMAEILHSYGVKNAFQILTKPFQKLGKDISKKNNILHFSSDGGDDMYFAIGFNPVKEKELLNNALTERGVINLPLPEIGNESYTDYNRTLEEEAKAYRIDLAKERHKCGVRYLNMFLEMVSNECTKTIKKDLYSVAPDKSKVKSAKSLVTKCEKFHYFRNMSAKGIVYTGKFIISQNGGLPLPELKGEGVVNLAVMARNMRWIYSPRKNS